MLSLLNSEANRRLGFDVFQRAVKLGALLRPLGDTIYWLPPLNIEIELIGRLANITRQAILSSRINFAAFVCP